MSYYKGAFIFSVISAFLLLVVLILPEDFLFNVHVGGGIDAGIFFPLLPICWGSSALAMAMNYLYVETLYMENYFKVSRTRKLIPAFISTPSICSFLWFCFAIV